jgi:hypothetical protein
VSWNMREGVATPEGRVDCSHNPWPNHPVEVRSVSLKLRSYKTAGDRELRSVDLC